MTCGGCQRSPSKPGACLCASCARERCAVVHINVILADLDAISVAGLIPYTDARDALAARASAAFVSRRRLLELRERADLLRDQITERQKEIAQSTKRIEQSSPSYLCHADANLARPSAQESRLCVPPVQRAPRLVRCATEPSGLYRVSAHGEGPRDGAASWIALERNERPRVPILPRSPLLLPLQAARQRSLEPPRHLSTRVE